jgi:hypothetical protein
MAPAIRMTAISMARVARPRCASDGGPKAALAPAVETDQC